MPPDGSASPSTAIWCGWPDQRRHLGEEQRVGDGHRCGPQWQQGLTDTIDSLNVPKDTIDILGNIPALPQSGPVCLAQHATDVQKCSGPVRTSLSPYNRAERLAAASGGSRYIDVTPWFCSTVCTAIIGSYEVYLDQFHVTSTYSFALLDVLTDALDLSSVASTPPH